MQDLDAQEVKMSTAKHLPLEKFQAIDMPLHNPVAEGQREGSTNGGIISTNPVDKAAEFAHMTPGFQAKDSGTDVE